MATIIDGKTIALQHREQTAARARVYTERTGLPVHLALLLVGEDPASQVYVRNKALACEKAGIRSTIVRMDASASEAEVIACVELWNADETVHGILVQLPLPKHISDQRVITTIDPNKDVDGFHPVNAGRLMIGAKGFVPCTPAGILELLRVSNVKTSGAHAVVLGRSNIVGKPIAALLAQKRPQGNATVTLCHTGTADIAYFTRQADIIIAAAGAPKLITADHVKPGVTVIDVGMNRYEQPDGSYTLCGDVDFDSVAPLAGAITPVPGGVGPMTIALLLSNTVDAAEGLAQ